MDAVAKMGRIIKQTAEKTADQGGIGCAKLVVFANAVEDNPFMAGAFHGVGEADCVINVGVSGPGVVYHALQDVKGAPFDVLAETIKQTAFRITRMGQLVAQEASRRLQVPFGVVDLSLAPTPAKGDSVARVLERMGLEICGTHGTTAALAMLNDAVKKGGLMASSHVGGLSGAFIPVSEDEGMIASAKAGVLSLDKLEAMTCVCSVGLDMIAVPGDTPAETISAIIADEAAIGMVNNKTTAVRLIPVDGQAQSATKPNTAASWAARRSCRCTVKAQPNSSPAAAASPPPCKACATKNAAIQLHRRANYIDANAPPGTAFGSAGGCAAF